MDRQKKLNKLALYVSVFAFVLFGLVYSAGRDVKAAEVMAYQYMPVSGATNYDDGSYADFNKSFNFSFVASTTNITKFDTWLFRSDTSGGVGNWCSSNYNNCGSSDFATFSIYSDSSRTQLLATTTVLWSSIQLCSDGNTTDWKCQAWHMANNQAPTVFIFDTPVTLSVSNTYYVTVTATAYVGMGFKNWNSDYAFQAYYDDNYSASNDYVMYYGNSPAYTILGQYYQLPVVYNICDSWKSENNWYLALASDTGAGLVWARNQRLTSCSGSVIYNQPADDLTSDTAQFYIYNGLDPEVAISQEFLNIVYHEGLSDESYIHYYYPQGYYINTTSGAGTSTLQFAYNVCADTNFASSTISLKNESSGVLTGLSYTPTTCTGIGELQLPYTQNLNLSFPASITYRNNGIEYLNSTIFFVNFYSDYAENIDLGDQEDGGIMYTWWRKFTNIFPFNFVFLFRDAWKLSATTPLTDELQFLDVSDLNGNVTIDFPSQWSASSSDQTITIWSKEYMTNDNETALQLFDKFRIASKYLQYFIFVFGLFALAKQLISELTENTNDDIK